MAFALAALALHGRIVNFDADTSLQTLLMIAFMTTIGLNARLELIRRGGVGVIKLLAIATLGGVSAERARHRDWRRRWAWIRASASSPDRWR